MKRLALSCLALLAGAPALPAQEGAGRAAVLGVWVTGDRAGAVRRRSGLALGVEGAFGVGRATVAVAYAQGSLDESGGGPTSDLVEGQLTAYVHPFRWVQVGLGPHIRSFVEAGGTQRWVMWEARVQGTTNVLAPVIAVYAEAWTVLGASVDAAEDFDGGRGLEGGLRIGVGHLPVAVRLRYRIERLDLGDGARRETIEHVALAVGLGRR
jgi:hypothetical protein